MATIRKQTNKSRIRQAVAVCQSQTFYPCTDRKGVNTTVAHSVRQRGEVESFYEVPVGKVWVRTRERSADESMLIPVRACWAVPE